MDFKIDIPFGAHDSELKGWEYTIPEGFTAEIKDGKVIVKEKKCKAMKAIESIIRVYGKIQGEWIDGYDMDTLVVHLRKAFAALEKQKESLHISETCKENAEYFTSQCGDNRFELIDKAKRDIIAKTNIESSPDEMKVLNSFLFRAWQMGWLGKYDVIVPEQKPTERSEKNDEIRKALIAFLEMNTGYFACNGFTKDDIIQWLKELRPSWKPSEDEERLINTSISFLKDFANKGYENAVECIDWLKSKLNGNTGK